MTAGGRSLEAIHPAEQRRIGEDARAGIHVANRALEQHTNEEMIEIIRGQSSTNEQETQYRRDMSMGEVAYRVPHRRAANVLANLRNLGIGVFLSQKQ